MALLTDTDLNKIINKNTEKKPTDEQLQIFNFDEKNLTPVGYDLRIGERHISKKKGLIITRKKTRKKNFLKISPGDTVLITTLENIWMPQNRKISAIILSKVSQVSKGLSHIATTIDADYRGNLLIAITNHSKEKIELKYGETFCTIVFFENLSPSTVFCKKEPGRIDQLMKHFEEESKKARRKEMCQKLIYAGIATVVVLLAIYGAARLSNNDIPSMLSAGAFALSFCVFLLKISK